MVGRSSRRRLCWYPPPSSEYLSPSLPPSFGLKGICSTESTCASERAGSYGLKLDTGRKGASGGRGSFTACCIKSQATRYLPLPRSCRPSPIRAAATAAATGPPLVVRPLAVGRGNGVCVPGVEGSPPFPAHARTHKRSAFCTDRPTVSLSREECRVTRTDGRTSERPLSIHKGANRALGGRGGSGCHRDIDEGRARRATPSSLHPSIPVRFGKLNEKERGGGAPPVALPCPEGGGAAAGLPQG